MKSQNLTRRAFFAQSGAAVGGGWIAAMLPDIAAAAAFVADAGARFAFSVLSPEEVRDVDAIASRIIPSDGTPGAAEAGAVQFVDRALETFMQGALPAFRDGLEQLNDAVHASHPDVSRFFELGTEDQIAVLKEAETTPFFGMVRFLTIAGTFSHPSYGGNTDRAGWQLIGFDDRHVWQPPFGAYEGEEE